MRRNWTAKTFVDTFESLRIPHFPQPRRRAYLATINLEMGPFYSIDVVLFTLSKRIGYVGPVHRGFGQEGRSNGLPLGSIREEIPESNTGYLDMCRNLLAFRTEPATDNVHVIDLC